jgi:hypothetical protein
MRSGSLRNRQSSWYSIRAMAKPEIIENPQELCALAPVTTAPIRHHVFVALENRAPPETARLRTRSNASFARGILWQGSQRQESGGSVVLTGVRFGRFLCDRSGGDGLPGWCLVCASPAFGCSGDYRRASLNGRQAAGSHADSG